MAEFKFSVIIISWQVKAELERCLTSLDRERNGQSVFEVTVVDNASADGSEEMVRHNFPRVRLMALRENIGFAQACNLAVKDSSAEYLLFLNPDTEVTAGFFSDLERVFIHHPRAAVIGGHILNADGSTQASVRDFPGLWVGLLEGTKLLGRLPWLASGYLRPKFDYSQSQAVDQVMGACFAVRAKIWRELEGFDKRFFVWFEEVDFCKRAKSAGYEVWYDHRLSLVHDQAKSFSQLSAFDRHRLFRRSLVHYLKKHIGLTSAGLVWLISLPAFMVTYFYDVVAKKSN